VRPGDKSGSDLGERRWRSFLEFSKGNSAPERLTRSSDDAHDRPVSVDALMRVAEAPASSPAFFPARSLRRDPLGLTLRTTWRDIVLKTDRTRPADIDRVRAYVGHWCPRSESNRHAFKGGGF
jgi:hypothetical protein